MSTTEFQLALHRGAAGFAKLQSQWSQLAKAKGNHFLHFPAWYHAQLETCDNPEQLLFVEISRAGQLQGVISLEATHIKAGPINIPALALAYANEMGLCDLFLPEPGNLQLRDLYKVLRTGGYRSLLMKFDCIRAGSFARQWIAAAELPTKHSHFTKYLDLSAGREQFYNSYSSKFNRNMRRKLKKAQEMGQVTVERFKNDAAIDAFNEFLRLEDSGWKGKDGTSIAKQPKKLRYYQLLTESFSRDGVLAVNLLKIGDVNVAAQVGVHIGSTLYLLKIAYDESYSEVSPGYLLIDGLITDIADPNYIAKLSFVTGVDWIDRWKPSSEEVLVAYDCKTGLVNGLLNNYLTSKAKKASAEDKSPADSEVEEN